jgi:hypothetical protein
MAKAKVTKRFELSEEAANRLEERAATCGMSQTAFVQDLIMCGWIQPVDSTMPNGAAVERTTEQSDAEIDRAFRESFFAKSQPDDPQSDASFSQDFVPSGYKYGTLSGEATQARTEKREARAGRKAELAKNIKASGLISDRGKGVLDANACQHPAGARTTGKNWKCTACGYQNEAGA